jgi:hypothetical protein
MWEHVDWTEICLARDMIQRFIAVKKLLELRFVKKWEIFCLSWRVLVYKKFSTCDYLFSHYYLIFGNSKYSGQKNESIYIFIVLNFFPPALYKLI